MPLAWRFSIEGQENDTFDMRLDYTGGPTDGLRFQRPFPEDRYRLDLDGIGSANRRLQPSNGAQDLFETKSQPVTLDQLERVGSELYRALFQGGGAEHFDLAYRAIRNSAAQPILGTEADENFLNIWIDAKRAAQLGNLPWEVLFDREGGGTFLATDQSCNIVRRLDPTFPQNPPAPITDKIRVLVAIANPQADLDTGTEFANIERQLGELMDSSITRLEVRKLDPANSENLSDEINQWKPHVVHFIGHGDFKEETGLISLSRVAAPEQAYPVDAQTFRQMMLNHRPWLVVLNSCLGGVSSRFDPFGGAAQALRQIDIPFVVAMQYSISDDAAIRFSHRLYSELGMGTPIAPAVSSARSAIRELEDPLSKIELITPVLYASTALHRIPLPAPTVMAVPEGIDGPDRIIEQEDRTRRQPTWWELGGLLLAAIGTATGVYVALWAEGDTPDDQPTVSPNGSGNVQPDPYPVSDPEQTSGNDGQDFGMPYSESGEGGGGWLDPDYSTGGYWSGGIYYCDDGSERDGNGECPPDFGDYNIAQGANSIDLNNPQLPDIGGPAPPPPEPPPPPPPPLCNFGPYIAFFDFGSATLTADARAILDSALIAYANCGGSSLLLSGHDDRAGTVGESLKMSEQRNEAVRAYFVGRGIPEPRISSQAFGESELRVQTADGVRELQNRRVEITSAPDGNARTEHEYDSAKRGMANDLRRIARILGLLQRFDEAHQESLIVSDLIDDPEREALIQRAQAALDREPNRESIEELRERTVALNTIRADLSAYLSPLSDAEEPIEGWLGAYRSFADSREELARFLDLDERRRTALISEEKQAEYASSLERYQFVSTTERNRRFSTLDEVRASANRIYDSGQSVRDAIEQYESEYQAFGKLIRTDFRLIDQAIGADEGLLLEITSPYQRVYDEELALCLGNRMRHSLIYAAFVFEDAPSNDWLFTGEGENAFSCAPNLPAEQDVTIGELDEDLAEWIEDGPVPAMLERIEVRTQRRRFEAPETGNVPLGAHTELRIRLENAETLRFASNSSALEPESVEALNRVAGWLDTYNKAVPQLSPIACEYEDEVDDQCPERPSPSMALIVEAGTDPSLSNESARLLAGSRLDAILSQLNRVNEQELIVTAVICQRAWHENKDGDDIINLSLVPEGVESALDYCVPQQEATYTLNSARILQE